MVAIHLEREGTAVFAISAPCLPSLQDRRSNVSIGIEAKLAIDHARSRLIGHV